MKKQVILTGLRTNAEYHLGNYLGAIDPIVRLANDLDHHQPENQYQINLFIPDLHSFTTPIDFDQFLPQTKANLKLLVACGLPLNKPNVYLYRQSYLPAHCQLTWILSNFSSFGELSRMVEFKDKSRQVGSQGVSVGLFGYPILMAADILLYDARWVPVGDDQRQHLEFTRRLAQSLNRRFGPDLFTVPASLENQQQFFRQTASPRIRSLRQPKKKMSKSANDPAGTILLSDDDAQVVAKVKASPTDSIGKINYDWHQQPGITNLLTILALTKNSQQETVNQQWLGTTDYQALKRVVSQAISDRLTTIQARLKKVDWSVLDDHLKASEQTLATVGQTKLEQVQVAIGLREKGSQAPTNNKQ